MSFKIKNRHRLKKRDIKDIEQQIEDEFFIKINLGDSVETGSIIDINVILVDNIPCFTVTNKKIFFTMQGLYRFKPKKNFIVVDMGAVKFVTNGADVMAPGIVDADKSIVENSQVWICDETHHKPLATGVALMDGQQMISESKGKAVKLLHYIGDSLWSLTNNNQ